MLEAAFDGDLDEINTILKEVRQLIFLYLTKIAETTNVDYKCVWTHVAEILSNIHLHTYR